jgi:predicted branched-subunit amino acid permease
MSDKTLMLLGMVFAALWCLCIAGQLRRESPVVAVCTAVACIAIFGFLFWLVWTDKP